jgi:Pyridoxamine 5'-phosphate oxidase
MPGSIVIRAMHETAEDIRELQELLDRSYERAGGHLRSITTPERRVDAEELVVRLTGMCLLVVATVTADCRPIAGPLDGIFYRGAFHFGTAPDSVRYRHLLKRPQVTATHMPAEEFAVNVHGRAAPIATRDPAHRGFRETLFEVYGPRIGAEEWERFLEGGDEPERSPVYMRIEAERMLTFQMRSD